MIINLKKIEANLILLFLSISFFMSDFFYRVPSITKDIIFVFFIIILIILEIKLSNINRKKFFIFFIFIFLEIYSILQKTPDLYGIRYYLYPFSIFYYVINYLDDNKKNLIKKFIIFYYWIICFVVISQIFLEKYKVLELLKYFSLEKLKIFRFYSFFSLPTLAGASLVVLGSYLFLEKKSLAYYFNTLLFLILTFSRGSILCYILFTIGYLLFSQKSIKKFILIGCIIIILFTCPFWFKYLMKDESFLTRLSIIVNLDLKNIILGNGIGYSTGRFLLKNKKVFDNEYVRLLYEIGIFGTFIYFSLFYNFFKKGSKKFKLICLVYFTLMLTMEVLTIYPVPIFLSLILGIIIIEDKNEKNIVCY